MKRSLQHYFRDQAVRWSLIGLALTFFLGVPFSLYSAKIASERQLFMLAKTTARVFRPNILEGNVRDAQFQMQHTLDLKEGESAIVRDTDLKAIYPLGEESIRAKCVTPLSACWSRDFRSLSYLYPIYFDDDTKAGLFGYLEVTIQPVIDWGILSLLGVLLLIAFVIQAIGLSSALTRCARVVVAHVANWADHLKNSPGDPSASLKEIPFLEFEPMQEAVSGLHLEIARLEARSAREAKERAQIEILRQVGHDLKTPLSQLGKYLMLFFEDVRETGSVEEKDVVRISRTLKRMGDLIRQVRRVPGSALKNDSRSESLNRLALDIETQEILNDLKYDEEIVRKGARLLFSSGAVLPEAQISKIGYYQILENLIGNAARALPDSGGVIEVILEDVNGGPRVSIKDNGSCISPDIQTKIFDLDFTTRPSKGTGLGLGIVKRICLENGASIEFESRVNAGTAFTVLFARADLSAHTKEILQEAPPYVSK